MQHDRNVRGNQPPSAPLCRRRRGGPRPKLALEYAKRSVRVNAVAAGVIKTPMHSFETYAQIAALHPVGHMGEISDIVDAILYLKSAAFVTGEILHVDGGQSAGH
jgi:NAD(P)-dependent dehydrogenase (short-subunit alcohol dehydrogenase family)